MYLICFCLILFKVVEIILQNKKRPQHTQITDLSFVKGEMTWGNTNQVILTATPGCLLKCIPISHFYTYITSLLILSRSDRKFFLQRTSTKGFLFSEFLVMLVKLPSRVVREGKDNHALCKVWSGLWFLCQSFQTLFQYLPEAFHKLTENQVDGTLSKL